MELDPNATTDLTAFFTKRFPSPEDRAVLARDARITFREPTSDDPMVAWGGLVTRAQEQAALPRLANCAARRRPSDENLQGVAATLNGRSWPAAPRPQSSMVWKQVGALAALVTIAGAAWAVRAPRADATDRHDADVSIESADVETVAAVPVPPAPAKAVEAQPSPKPGTGSDEPTTASEEAPATAEEPAGAASPEPVDSPAASAAAPEEPPTGSAAPTDEARSAPATTSASSSTTSCGGRAGEVVGYWYAGTTSPGKKGDRIRIPRDLNVRADYPDTHNRYNRRAEIRCTLGVGQTITLLADPIEVPGGAYWVPLLGNGS
jgi:hypothetical protein